MAKRSRSARPGNRQSADAHECARASAPRAKRVMMASYGGDTVTELARFRLRPDGKVEAKYKSDIYRGDIESGGIVAYDRVVFPSDGRVFFDTLDLAYSHSTLVYVEAIADLDRDDTDGVRGCAESNATDGAWR